MRIGIISDTHGRLHPRVPELFAGVDAIVHAGDVGDPAILGQLRAIAPLTAVAGNIDGFVCGDAGEEARATFDDLRVYVTHILPRPDGLDYRVTRALAAQPADVVIFGHSHLPHDEHVDGVWFFNPASAGPRRFDYPVSIGFLERGNDGWSARHVALDERSEVALVQRMNQLTRD
jgi:putative phosphoesterase